VAFSFAILASGAENPRHAQFDVRHELTVKIPDGAKKVRVWFALPLDVSPQKVSGLKIESERPYRIETDSQGNKTVYVEADAPGEKEIHILATFNLERAEIRGQIDPAQAQPLSADERARLAPYLEPNTNIVIDDTIRALARQIVGDETNTLKAARKIYDWVLTHIDYWVKDPAHHKASPVGSSEYCLATKTGNCSDFSSLWSALARASGIPTRMVYGAFFKAELDGKDIDQSYHCWTEFYVGNIGWISQDVAVANIFVGDIPLTKENEVLVRRTTADGYHGPDPAKVDYYFGNLDERRVAWSVGRDLTLSPKQDAGPVNALPKAYVEVDGKPLLEKDHWMRKLTYTQKK